MRRLCLVVLVLAMASACQKDPPPGAEYFERIIQPILDSSCSKGTSGCHKADPGDPFAFAAGNLDTSSFENIHKRPDVLRQYGPYPAPLLLMKAVGPTEDLKIVYRTQQLPLRIPHAGGTIFRVGSEAYLTLQQWLSNGATRDGIRPAPAPVHGDDGCTAAAPASWPSQMPRMFTRGQLWAGIRLSARAGAPPAGYRVKARCWIRLQT